MTFAELDRLVRQETTDTGGDLFIQDWQMFDYANEAECEACRRSRILTDSTTTAICQIPVVAGTAVYDVDARIIFVKRAIIAGATNPLRKISATTLDEEQPGWHTKSGTSEYLVAGLHSRKLQLHKIPTANGTLHLTVIRRPLAAMTTGTSTPEIPEQHHRALVHWIKHRIWNNQDSELFDKNRADVHLAEFEKYFGKRCAHDDLLDEMPLVRCGDDTVASDYL